ncbi:MAG: hypothetical protein DCF22_21720, partial [Leptolyngbya sp.]
MSLPPFSQRFEHECVYGSAIAPELFKSAIAFILDEGRYEPNYFLGQTVSHQWQTQKPHSYGALGVFIQELGEPWQAKPELPRFDQAKNKPIKYEAIKGNGSRAFLPAIPLKTWKRISQKHQIPLEAPWQEVLASQKTATRQASEENLSIDGSDFNSTLESSDLIRSNSQDALPATFKGFAPNSKINIRFSALRSLSELKGLSSEELKSALESAPDWLKVPDFWKFIEAHPEIPIIPTEGGKKSLCLLSHGYVAIALYGVRGGVLENETIGGEKVRRLKPELIPDLKRFAVPGRKITLAFDQDLKPKTVLEVNRALSRLGWVLQTAGCQVAVAEWDSSQGKGIDDLIVNQGAGAWEKALSEAVSFAQWAVSRQLAHEVRRKPDLNIGDREFVEVAAEL